MPYKKDLAPGEVLSVGEIDIRVEKRTKIHVDAPKSMKIETTTGRTRAEPGQNLSPEKQRELSLAKFNRGNRK